MKKLLSMLAIAMLLMMHAMASSVSQTAAQTVALNFYKATIGAQLNSTLQAVLNYTKTGNDGTVYFYVFNISPAKGFVIVSGDNVVEPVIGYSLESSFNPNGKQTGIVNWMQTAAQKISGIISAKLTAPQETASLWNAYISGAQVINDRASSVSPLCATTWNQEPYYNMYCPYNSTNKDYCVTGCVATAMAQIMKYWNYPAQGTGSYSYDDAPPSFSNNYGVQSANFAATTYNWASMPNSISANDTYIGTLMYQCGVSVAMDYGDDSQGGSGAFVFASGNSPSAQKAYSTYFSYNAGTMQALNQSSYSSAAWITLLQNELNASRPIEYLGYDPGVGGHTWVCDGYDVNNMFHMNWGWGGIDNGYFSLSDLNPNPYTFSSDDGALIGIQPGTTSTCSVPGTLSTSSITTSTATFNWAAVSGAQSYNVQYTVVGSGTWTSETSTTNSYNASGLTAGTNYEWEVQTVCSSSSSSAFTSPATFSTNAPACTTPTALSTSTVTTSTATFNWGTVAGAQSYKVQYSAVGSGAWTSATSTANSYNASGLNAGSNYEWEVQTVCSSSSSSPFTSPATFTTTAAACSTPATLSTSNISTTTATFSWGAVSGAQSYKLQYSIVGSGSWTIVTSTTNSYNASGLTAGSNYEWEVQTVCSSSSSSSFASLVSFTTIAAACSTPATLSTSSITGTTATFNWGTVSGAQSYKVQYSVVGSGAWTSVTATTSSYNASGLMAGTNYEWEVETVCSSSSSSSFTAPIDFTTTSASCGVPTGLSVGSITASGATLTWGSVSGVLSYTLQYKATSAITWTTISNVANNSYPLSGLASCTAYQFNVLTVCSGGSSVYSSAGSFTTSGCAVTYCASAGISTSYEYINNVTLGSINNTSGDNKGYGNFTALSTNLAGGSTYTISLTPGWHYGAYREYFNVWIDYNHDGVFTDAGDLVAQGSTSGTLSLSFTVPTTALNGATRMRVQMQYAAYPGSPCLTYTYGEVEDYTVNITGDAHIDLPSTGSNTDESLSKINLYPNPAKDNLNVEFSTNQDGNAIVNVYDVLGKKVATQEFVIAQGTNTFNINTAVLSQGIYIFEIINNGEVQRQKFMISR